MCLCGLFPPGQLVSCNLCQQQILEFGTSSYGYTHRRRAWKESESMWTQGMECPPTFTLPAPSLGWDSLRTMLSTTSSSWPQRYVLKIKVKMFYHRENWFRRFRSTCIQQPLLMVTGWPNWDPCSSVWRSNRCRCLIAPSCLNDLIFRWRVTARRTGRRLWAIFTGWRRRWSKRR